jgi:hypothetical protein
MVSCKLHFSEDEVWGGLATIGWMGWPMSWQQIGKHFSSPPADSLGFARQVALCTRSSNDASPSHCTRNNDWRRAGDYCELRITRVTNCTGTRIVYTMTITMREIGCSAGTASRPGGLLHHQRALAWRGVNNNRD